MSQKFIRWHADDWQLYDVKKHRQKRLMLYEKFNTKYGTKSLFVCIFCIRQGNYRI